MKFKGIELKDNTEAELLIEIEIVDINDEDELEEYGEELEGKLEDILDYDNCSPDVDFIDDNLLNIKVMINVHVDGKEWFKKEDGSEYNEDSVTLEEFLLNIEY